MKTISKRILGIILGTLLLFSTTAFISCGTGGGNNISIPGVEGPYLILQEDKLLITMIMSNLQIEGGGRIPIPKYENSYMELSPDLQSGGTMLAFYISLQDIFGGKVDQLDPQTLPGGRNLPGVPSGRLPASAFTIESLSNTTVYLGSSVFGLFVPMKKVGMQGTIATFRFYTGGNRAGNISIVGSDENGENSGILLLLDMNATTTKFLKSVAKKYR
jgi:hypothetical protein